jgi:phage baseplate assembly protein W
MTTRADTITQLSKMSVIYSDVTNNFTQHPVSGDLVVLKNQDSIIQAIKNLLLTNPGERLFDPFFGSGITGCLFEQYTPFLNEDIIKKINLAVKMFEPRINNLLVSITPTNDGNGFVISVVISIVNIPQSYSFSFPISRVR